MPVRKQYRLASGEEVERLNARIPRWMMEALVHGSQEHERSINAELVAVLARCLKPGLLLDKS